MASITIGPCIGCCGGCPPAGSPTHVAVTVNETITFNPVCYAGDPVVTTNSISGGRDIDPDAWLQSTGFNPNLDFNSCYQQFSFVSAGSFSYACAVPDDCAEQLPVPLNFSFFLVFEGTSWFLVGLATTVSDPDPTVFCGDPSDFSLFSSPIDIGINPIGSHPITLMGSGVSATVSVVLS